MFKPWHERHSRESYVESDADEQLIVHIPFTSDVTLKSICIIAATGEEHPSKMLAFKNREDVDFDNADAMRPDQEWALNEDPEGSHPYETLIAKFNGLRNINLYFPENFGGEKTKIYFIGLRGQSRNVNRRTIISIAGEFLLVVRGEL